MVMSTKSVFIKGVNDEKYSLQGEEVWSETRHQ